MSNSSGSERSEDERVLPDALVAPHAERLDPSRSDYAAILAAHAGAIAAGEAGYLDPTSGLFVLTAATHWSRGTCCDQGCRHCPYLVREGAG